MSFWQLDTPLSSSRITFPNLVRWFGTPLSSRKQGFVGPHFWFLTGYVNLTLPEAIIADHEVDQKAEELVILKFPTAERQRQQPPLQPVGKIKRHAFLGGLLSHYERTAT